MEHFGSRSPFQAAVAVAVPHTRYIVRTVHARTAQPASMHMHHAPPKKQNKSKSKTVLAARFNFKYLMPSPAASAECSRRALSQYDRPLGAVRMMHSSTL
eukprot:scaffold61414_cov25-Tisochrysis_lutea.AAC.6